MSEQLLQQIAERITALGEQVSEQRLVSLIKAQLDLVANDPAFVRKMRFGGAGDHKLAGSKYARWGLCAADIEFLYDLQTALRGAKRIEGGVYQGPSETLSNAFRAVSEAAYFTSDEVKQMGLRELEDEVRINRMTRQQWEHAVRSMDTAESGYGSQLIGAQYIADLWEAARPESRVFNLLQSMEMQAPTVYMPVEVDIPELYYVSESTSNGASAYGSVKTGSNRVSMTAAKFVIHQIWSGEMEEDSIIPFIPFLRRQQQLSLAHYMDSLVLNGDTTNEATNNINLVDANPADTKHYLAFDGIRHAALVDNTDNAKDASGGAVSLELFRDVYGRMVDATYLHDWGHPTRPEDVVHVVDPYTGDKLLTLDELVTVDKFGPNATILNGQVARIFQHPIISSIALAKSNSSGMVSNTAGNNLYGQIVSFNRNGLKIGWRRRVVMETERILTTDQTRIVASLRMALGRFTPTGAASGIEWADTVYNIGL